MALRGYHLFRKNIFAPQHSVFTKTFTTKILFRSPAFNIIAKQTPLRASALAGLTQLPTLQIRVFSEKAVVRTTDTLDTVRKDLSKLITEELGELQTDELGSAQYLQEKKYKLEKNEDKITVTRTENGYTTTVSFDLPNDDNLEDPEKLEQFNTEMAQRGGGGGGEGEGEERERVEGEEGEEGEENQGEGEQPNELQKIKEFSVTISKEGAKNKLIADCCCGADHRLYIENIRFQETDKKLWLEDLSTSITDRLYDFFEHNGVDDGSCAFILDYIHETKVKNTTERLEQLKEFLGKTKSIEAK